MRDIKPNTIEQDEGYISGGEDFIGGGSSNIDEGRRRGGDSGYIKPGGTGPIGGPRGF